MIRDEEFYIDMMLKSVLPFVDYCYILDTGSKDKTLDIIKEKFLGKVFLEVIDVPGHLWNNNFDEGKWRNHTLKRATEIFHPDYFLLTDGDEAWLPQFFEDIKSLDSNVEGLWTSTYCLVAPDKYYNGQPKQMMGDHMFHDPHARFVSAKVGFKYIHNPNLPGSLHHLLLQREEKKPSSKFFPGFYHLHLHQSFGPKCELINSVDKGGIPEGNIFLDKDPQPVPVSIPDYILDKWAKWLKDNDQKIPHAIPS